MGAHYVHMRHILALTLAQIVSSQPSHRLGFRILLLLSSAMKYVVGVFILMFKRGQNIAKCFTYSTGLVRDCNYNGFYSLAIRHSVCVFFLACSSTIEEH